MEGLAQALRQVDGWPCAHVAVAVTGRVEASHGDTRRIFPWTSVTKAATAIVVLVAAEEGIVDLDEPAGPPGSTVRHLLAHASGLPFEGSMPDGSTGRTADLLQYRLRSAGAHWSPSAPRCPSPATSKRSGAFPLAGSPAHGAEGPLDDFSHSRASCSSRRGSAARRSTRPSRCSSRASPASSGLRPHRAERLGTRPRAARRQEPALDGHAQLAAYVRPLRAQRHVPLGRSRSRARARLPHRPRLRRVGQAKPGRGSADAVLARLSRVSIFDGWRVCPALRA